MEPTGKAVKAWAKKERVQLREIAAALDVSYTHLSRWLSGARRMPESKAAELRVMMSGSGVPAPVSFSVREQRTPYGDAPDRLAVAVGALWVIRDAADAALRRVEATTAVAAPLPVASQPVRPAAAAHQVAESDHKRRAAR